MPNYRRLFYPGGTYFFTLTLADRRGDLLVRHIDALRAAYKYVEARHPFTSVAAVILPDHMHLLWTLPEDDHAYPKRIRLLKSHFTRALPEAFKAPVRRGERGIWQRRYWEHLIRDETDFDNHFGYIHANTVKHGLVAHPDEWPFSTWHRFKQDYPKAWSLDDLHEAGER